jgi:small subunit ribosomal protein S1
MSNTTEETNVDDILKKDDKNEKKVKKPTTFMDALVQKSANPPELGDLIEGPVISIEKGRILVDLKPFGTGIIYGREFIAARNIIKNVSIGDTIDAKVVDVEGKEGYIELSLREARQAIIWSEAEEAIRNKTVFELPVKEANKGGLILNWQGIPGFIPASQLSTENYPRVEDGDKDRILEQLKNLVDKKLTVSIISAIPKEGKLIFSEKGPEHKEKVKIIEKYQLGDTVEGEVTGVVDFGVFVKLEENLEGLVHISELDWGLVEDPRKMFKVGEIVKAKIIEIKDDKISLSIKALQTNPWKNAEGKYKKGDKIEAVIIKYNKHGALASVEEGVAGLVHVSEFDSSEDKLRETLELGKSYPFTISLFEPSEQKMTLSYENKEVS